MHQHCFSLSALKAECQLTHLTDLLFANWELAWHAVPIECGGNLMTCVSLRSGCALLAVNTFFMHDMAGTAGTYIMY